MTYRRRSLLLVSALLAGRAFAVDTPATDQWIVTSAKATGAGGEEFVTSLRIVNTSATDASVTIKLLPQTVLDAGGNALGDNTAGPTVAIPVPAGRTVAVEDVIGTRFSGAAAAAGLRATSDVPVIVMSQTLVANARSSSGVPGTYGFAIPSQTTDDALALGETAWIPYVAGAPDSAASGYRTNLFLLSANASASTTVNVKLVNASGGTVGEGDFQLGKLSQTQINRIASRFGSQTADTNMTAVVTVKSGGPVFLGASVIDNAISSILYTPPTKIWRPRNASYGLNLDDGGYGFSGRLNVEGGVPTFLSASLVVECPSPSLFFLQAASYSPWLNTTFTQTGDGAWSFIGSTKNSDGSTAATFTGTLLFAPDGSVSGQLVYTRGTVAGNTCAGTSKTFPFQGTKFGTLTAAAP